MKLSGEIFFAVVPVLESRHRIYFSKYIFVGILDAVSVYSTLRI
jgi:hypothetical protein